MSVYRTPDEQFTGLPDFGFAPRYTDLDGLRMHHVEAGPAGDAAVLLLHGEPTWSFLYRRMLPVFAAAGYRAIAPDLIGFGRSDKPTDARAYGYSRHVAWMAEWIRRNGLRRITLVGQDWGSLIGLRLVAELPDLFERVVIANGFLPSGEGKLPPVFRLWAAFARWSPVFPISRIVQAGCARGLSPAVRTAYDAPFPVRRAKAAARVFPRLVPRRYDDAEAAANRQAWAALRQWTRPFLTIFGTADPIFRGLDRVLQRRIPGAAGQPHSSISGAGHFIQEDAGEELARRIVHWMDGTPPTG